MVNTYRYWDGHRWTEHRQAAIPAPIPPAYFVTQDINTTPGYVFAILIPFVGFILGVTYLGKKTSDGIQVLVLSLVGFLVWALLLAAVGA